MGANFLLKKNAGISLSAEGVFIAITTWANKQVQHVLILWDSGKRPQLIKSVRGGRERQRGLSVLCIYLFILIGYLFYFKLKTKGQKFYKNFDLTKSWQRDLVSLFMFERWTHIILLLREYKLMKLTSDQCLLFKNIIIKCKPQWIICSCFSVLRFTQT